MFTVIGSLVVCCATAIPALVVAEPLALPVAVDVPFAPVIVPPVTFRTPARTSIAVPVEPALTVALYTLRIA